MTLTFQPKGWDDYLHWQATDRAMLRKLNALIEGCLRHPHEGTGKPEPLRGETFAISTIHEFYRRYGITFKKRRRMPASRSART